jgi:hypothetical protein
MGVVQHSGYQHKCQGCKGVLHGGPWASREVDGKLWCFPCGDPTVAKESNPIVAKLAADWTSQSQEYQSSKVDLQTQYGTPSDEPSKMSQTLVS